MSQGCKGRESQRSISSSSDIKICYRYSGERWNWGGNGSAGQRHVAGTSEIASEPGERQGWRGGKGHDVDMGMTYNIVAKQECDISVSHLYKWALRVVNR
jgi:hypothetical protein